MSVPRHPAPRQVPLARMALLAGEAFGHQSTHDYALGTSAYSSQARSALALMLVVFAIVAAYLAI